jgi:D-alanyl-D-alanine carboxypeptidase
MIRNKIERAEIVSIKVLIIVIFITGFLLTASSCSNVSSNDIDLNLKQTVSELVEKNKSIENCILAVAKSDGSYSWSGAAGIANEDGQIPMTKDTTIYIASVTKLFTATVVMKLYEEGLLSLDDPMSKYLSPDYIKGLNIYNGKDYSNEITIKQLLANTSGIADYYEEKGKDGKSAFDILVEDPDSVWTVDSAIARTRDELQPHFAPGTGAFYSDANFLLLGKIIENVAQKPLQTVYEDYIFQPCGCTHTWLVNLSRPQVESVAPADIFYEGRNITRMRLNGADWADGGIISTPEDMIIFLKALNEGKIVSKDTVKLMHEWHKLKFPMQYGYGTMYFKLPPLMTKVTKLTPLWGHSGSTGSFLYYSEELDLYMAGTINYVGSNMKPFMLMGDVMKQFNTDGNPR